MSNDIKLLNSKGIHDSNPKFPKFSVTKFKAHNGGNLIDASFTYLAL